MSPEDYLTVFAIGLVAGLFGVFLAESGKRAARHCRDCIHVRRKPLPKGGMIKSCAAHHPMVEDCRYFVEVNPNEQPVHFYKQAGENE